MRGVSGKSCRDSENTHFVIHNFFKKNHALYGIMWKNIVKPDMPQMTVRRMLIAWWIPRATNTLIMCNNYCFSTTTMIA